MRYLFESPKKAVAPKPKNMASSITSKVLEIRKESIKNCMGDFESMSHRQHYIDTIDGVSYYDDAQAESVNATWFTFENILNPVVWIVGGSGHTNYSELIETAKRKVKAIVSLGNEKENIEMTFKGAVNEIYEASDIAEAVKVASIIADENDLVLFSPACKDQEAGYETRGSMFIDEVKKMTE